MEPISLPLERGGALPDTSRSPLWRRGGRPIRRHPHASSATSLSPRLMTREQFQQQQLMRRVSSYQDNGKAIHAVPIGTSSLTGSSTSASENSHLLLRQESNRLRLLQQRGRIDDATSTSCCSNPAQLRERMLEVLVNVTSGVIAFLLSSTLTVSCASVVVGHATPLATVIAKFIDMNLLGTAVLCLMLAWQSEAPWTLGAIDVFVAPIMASMAERISMRLDGDLDVVVPTTIVMVALTSFILGLVFFFMGICRVTSIANYMPYPVIAGFLSGIGAELIKNGVHMASSKVFTAAFFTFDQQQLILPAIAFASVARLGQHLHWPVAISFPCLLIGSLVAFQGLARVYDLDLDALRSAGWVFSWSETVIRDTPMWFPWTEIAFDKIQWHVLASECFGFVVSLVVLGALKYSVATTSLSTLFGRDISPDNEMRVIGLANIVSGALGCCGGCHYLSAMGIMKQFRAHERVPAVVCAVLLLSLWVVGIRSLQYVPKFIFGGLLLSVGVHFLEAYLVAPFKFLKPLEQAIVVLITASFLVIGMLASVGLGILISMIDLIYRIHEVGCVHHETTGALARSSVDRTPEQTAYLDAEGSAVFVLRLQGYLFFGTSVNILERIETRVQSLDFVKLQCVVIDFGLVPSFDATALMNFRKATTLADLYQFDLYYCGLKPAIDAALRQTHARAHHDGRPANSVEASTPQRVHLLSGDIDVALETCENALLPRELTFHATGSFNDWQQMSHLQLWDHFIAFHHDDLHSQKLLPLAAYLDVVVVKRDELLCPLGIVEDTYFICFGYLNVMGESEFSTDRHNIPGVNTRGSGFGNKEGVSYEDGGSGDTGVASVLSGRRRKLSLGMADEPQWMPFTTAESRLRKIGPGSIVTPDALANGRDGGLTQYHRYVATSDCVLLRLSDAAMEKVEDQAPHTAVEILKLVNTRLAFRFLNTNKRITHLSSLLYK